MQIKEQFRKHSNWTITAMTAGAVTVVAATGLGFADDGGSRGSLQNQITLQDSTPVRPGQAFQLTGDGATLIPAPIIQAGDISNSFDSPLDAASPSMQSAASVASVQSVASPAPLDSYDTPAGPDPAPAQAPAYEDSFDSFSAESFDSPS
jgi:hypothetical protein